MRAAPFQTASGCRIVQWTAALWRVLDINCSRTPVWTGRASETCSSNGIGHRVSHRCVLLLKVLKDKIWLWHREEDQRHNLSGRLLLSYRDHHHQTKKKIIHVQPLVTDKQFMQNVQRDGAHWQRSWWRLLLDWGIFRAVFSDGADQ